MIVNLLQRSKQNIRIIILFSFYRIKLLIKKTWDGIRNVINDRKRRTQLAPN